MNYNDRDEKEKEEKDEIRDTYTALTVEMRTVISRKLSLRHKRSYVNNKNSKYFVNSYYPSCQPKNFLSSCLIQLSRYRARLSLFYYYLKRIRRVSFA